MTQKRMVGHLLYGVGLVLLGMSAEPIPMTLRQWAGLGAFAALIAYAGYHCGWINGHDVGWRKARDEYRPNSKPLSAKTAETKGGEK